MEFNEKDLLDHYQNPVDSIKAKDERLFNLSPILGEKEPAIDDFD